MRKTTLSILLACLFITVHAQQQRIKQVEQDLKVHTQADNSYRDCDRNDVSTRPTEYLNVML